MNLILFDHPTIRQNLLPFTFTRPVAAIRAGILTIAEKWEHHFEGNASFSTEKYLSKKFPLHITSDNLWVNGAVCPTIELVSLIKGLPMNGAIRLGSLILAVRTADDEVPEVITGPVTEFTGKLVLIDEVWKIFQHAGDQIREDYELITRGRASAKISDPHTRVYNSNQIFLEEDVEIRAAILNAENGPIYLGKGSQVHEGAIIKGPFSLGEGSHVNMGAKVRGDTSIGPYCKIGGEVSNSILFGYSNKGHDGFLGNSVLGEWCNLGADTNTSNLKNNYEPVKLWSYAKDGFKNTGLTFCGLMMGDHSKCGINTMFNTGTVVGVSANIFGDGYPRNFVPSYAWGGASGFSTFQFEKAMVTATKAMERRSQKLEEVDHDILREVYEQSARYRVWEKK